MDEATRPQVGAQRFWIFAAMLVVLSATVRLLHLDHQILGGDELHVLRVVAESPPSEIVGRVGDRDFSIPLALFYRAWSSVRPLSERDLRLPIVIAGALLPLFGFLLARRLVGPRPAFLGALLLAAHPLAIFYGRFVRPYGIATCCVLLAVLCLELWWTRRKMSAALGAGLLFALAAWFHLASAIAVAWIVVAYVLRARASADTVKAPRVRGVVAIGAIAAGVTLVLFAPALGALKDTVASQYTGEGQLTTEAIVRNLRVLGGEPFTAGILALLLAGWGGRTLWRRDRGVAWVVLLPPIGQLVSVVLLSPSLLEFSFVLARYQFVVLPFWAMLAATGLVDFAGRIGRLVRLRPEHVVPPVGALAVAAWFCVGPYGEISYTTRSPFAHHNAFTTHDYWVDQAWWEVRKGGGLPEAYYDLRGASLVLEGPAPEAFYDNPLAKYRMFHGRPVKLLAAPDTFWASERFAFRNVIPADRLAETRLPTGTVALLHQRGVEEVAVYLDHPASPAASEVYSVERVATIEAALRERFGPPKVQTPFVTRFDDAPEPEAPAPAAGAPPNIVLIVADDLGRGDVSWFEGDVPTPGLDRLMSEGLTLERFYTQPSCTSTRAGLLTGRHPLRFGMQHDVVRPWETFGLPAEEVTLPELLAEAGYEHRAIFGKWHLGHAQRAHHPLSHGFTEFFGHYNGYVGYFDHTRERSADGTPARDWHRGFDSVPEVDGRYATELVADEAVRFVREHAQDDSPFFLYLPFLAPHAPNEAPEELVDALADLPEPRRTFLAKVHALGGAVERVLDVLDETGIDEETLVVFLSDNGGDPSLGANNGSLPGGKHSLREGGLRVPAAVRWKGTIEPRQRTKEVVAYIDLLPTLAAFAGAAAPSAVDGVDVSSLWLEGAPVPLRSLRFYIERDGEEHLALIHGNWKLVRQGAPILGASDPRRTARELALYAIRNDPSEERNLVALHPERVDVLLDVLATFRALRSPYGLEARADPPAGWAAPVDWRIAD